MPSTEPTGPAEPLAPFDVVVVPDFSGRAAITFEARTLYFLASWLEFSAHAGFPLHLACIGDPPPSVVKLAERCAARITVHAPATGELGVYANKLRGFEVARETGRILLLDVDILVLDDVTELARLVPADAISAAPSHSAIILPEMWAELYARLDVPPPRARMRDFHVDTSVDPMTPGGALFPSFNTGVIVAPWSSPLPALWLEHLAVLGAYRARWNEQLRPRGMSVTDEPAFATAVHALLARGARLCALPDRFNGRWRHLYRRTPKLDEFAIFHMTTSFAYGTSLAQKLDPTALGYQKKLLRRFGKRWLRHSTSHAREAIRNLVPASLEVAGLRPILRTLYREHIRPVVG